MADQSSSSSGSSSGSGPTPRKTRAVRTPRLGRGLSSLMGTAGIPVAVTPPVAPPVAPPAAPSPTPPFHTSPTSTIPPTRPAEGLIMVAPEDVVPNRYQPRQTFNDEALAELAQSIKESGLMQPPIVRRDTGESVDGDQYELVAGERRWRAAQLAGLTVIPVILRELDDRQVNEWALVENLQREDLDPIEKAEAFHHLADRFKLSHDEIAQRVGVNRSTITNSLRLLTLPAEVQTLVRKGTEGGQRSGDGKGEGGISGGHAKALAGLSDVVVQLQLAKLAANMGWSVRQLEQAVRRRSENPSEKSPKVVRSGKSAHLEDLEARLAEALQTKVRIRTARKKGAGTLEIDFYNLDQFDALLQRLDVNVN